MTVTIYIMITITILLAMTITMFYYVRILCPLLDCRVDGCKLSLNYSDDHVCVCNNDDDVCDCVCVWEEAQVDTESFQDDSSDDI